MDNGEVERRVYDNGLVAMAYPMAHKRKAFIQINIYAGSKNEPTVKKGGAHLLEHMLFKTNGLRTDSELAELSEFNGVFSNASTSVTSTNLIFKFLPESLPLVLNMAYSTVIGSDYVREEFDMEKSGPVTDELLMMERDPSARLNHRVFMPETWRGTPYAESPIGTLESLENLTLGDLVSFKQEFYVPNNMVIAVAGNVDPGQFFENVGKTFGTMNSVEVIQPEIDWALEPRLVYVAVPEFKNAKDNRRDQSNLHLAYQICSRTHSDFLSTMLLETILGNGFTSRLLRELRVKRGIGYSPEAGIGGIRDYNLMVMGVPGLRPDRVIEAHDVIREIVLDLKTSELSEAYVDGKKNQLVSDYLDGLEGMSSHTSTLINNEFTPLPFDYRKVPELVGNITAGELMDVARRNFSKEPLIILANPDGYESPFD